MKTNIRKSTIADFEQVYVLLPQLWPDAILNKNKLRHVFARALNSDYHHYLCAIDKKVVVGFCSLSIRNSLWQQGFIAHIDEIIVESAYRGHGIGTQMILKAMKIAKQKGCTRLELDSAFHRGKAHNFYKKIGFENRAFLFSMPLEVKIEK